MKIVNTRLTRIFIAIFAPDERLPSSATLQISTHHFCNSRAQVVKIGHRFIVDSISAFLITDNTFRYNRESARSIRIPSLSLLISRRSSSAHVEKLPSVVTRSRLAPKHAREFGEEQGLGTKTVKRKTWKVSSPPHGQEPSLGCRGGSGTKTLGFPSLRNPSAAP